MSLVWVKCGSLPASTSTFYTLEYPHFTPARNFDLLGFFNIPRTIIMKVIQIGTVSKLGCGFIFAIHSNYGSILHHFQCTMHNARLLASVMNNINHHNTILE